MHFLTQIQVQCVMHSDMGFWSLQGALGSYFGGFGDSLGGSWGLVGPLGRLLSALWALMGTSWGPFEDPWGPFGYPLGTLWELLGMAWALLGRFWELPGRFWEPKEGPRGLQEVSKRAPRGFQGGPRGAHGICCDRYITGVLDVPDTRFRRTIVWNAMTEGYRSC